MNPLYITIANSNIRIDFKKTPNLILQKKMRSAIEIFFKDFIIKKLGNTDFTVEFADMDLQNSQYINKNNRYILFAREDGVKKTTTFYQISISQLQAVIQNAFYQVLTSDGFLLHASACEIEGKAILFLGGSGAGKSTAVNLVKNRFPTLSDDLSIIRKVGNEYYFYQHPFEEKNPVSRKTIEEHPIGNFFFINKSSKEFKIRPIKNKEVVLEKLVKQLVTPNKNMVENLMEFVSGFEKSYCLDFAKNSQALSRLIGRFEE